MSVYVAKHRAPDIDDDMDERDMKHFMDMSDEDDMYDDGDIPETDDEMYKMIDNA